MSDSKKDSVKRVALLFPNRRIAYLDITLHGILDYARQRKNWLFVKGSAVFKFETMNFPVTTVNSQREDGIISILNAKSDVTAVRKLGVPVVTFSGVLRDPGVARVMVDHVATGRLAAEHLLARGYTHFAFSGIDKAAYSDDRGEGFLKSIAPLGVKVYQHSGPATLGYRNERADIQKLGRWIAGLPKPVGVFAANDHRARFLADACQHIGAAIPTEVGIVGSDNDEVACEFGTPTISSVARDWYQIGFQTARLLDRLMEGEKPSKETARISPVGVIVRESTQAAVSSDPLVARALAYMSTHAAQPFNVEALVLGSGTSRRNLELTFQRTLGCSPMAFLMKWRIEQAKGLLQQPALSMTQISRLCGFTSLRHFRRTFSRITGTNPKEYQASIQSLLERN